MIPPPRPLASAPLRARARGEPSSGGSGRPWRWAVRVTACSWLHRRSSIRPSATGVRSSRWTHTSAATGQSASGTVPSTRTRSTGSAARRPASASTGSSAARLTSTGTPAVSAASTAELDVDGIRVGFDPQQDRCEGDAAQLVALGHQAGRIARAGQLRPRLRVAASGTSEAVGPGDRRRRLAADPTRCRGWRRRPGHRP